MKAPKFAAPSMPALTSLRFIAAFFVVLSHLDFLRNSTSEIVRWLATNIFAEGYIGVTFFFILSGFILSQAYSCRLPTSGGEIHDFYVARLARVVPLHLLTLAASIPLFVLERKHSYGLEAVVQLSVNAALLQSFVPCPSWYFSFNSPSWSLSVELMFYALFPLLALISNRNLIILAGITLLAKICLFGFAPQFYDHFLQYIFPPLRLPDFVVGILASRLFGIVKFSNAQATSLQTVAVGTLIIFAVLGRVIPQAMRFDVFYIFPMSMIVFAFAFSRGRLALALSGDIMVLLGESSFALYLVHQLVIRFGKLLIDRLGITLATWQADMLLAVVYLAVSFGVAITLYLNFEMTAKKFLRALFTPQRALMTINADSPSAPIKST